MPKEKKPTEKPAEDAQEQGNTEANTEPAEAESSADTAPEDTAQEEAAPPELSEVDRLKEENFRLKTQLEAMKAGFVPEVIEDAVILAENIVKRDGSDISAALKAAAKKYPAWTAAAQDEKQKGGFKVGADSSGGKSADDDEKLNQIFGIRKKK